MREHGFCQSHAASVGECQHGDNDPILEAGGVVYAACLAWLRRIRDRILCIRSAAVDWPDITMMIKIGCLTKNVCGKVSHRLIEPMFLLRPRTKRPRSTVTAAG